MIQRANTPKKVIFTERAYASVLAETNEMIATETGGVFLGVAQRDVYYIIETIDPGPNSIFQTAYFEYDKKYISHLVNKVNKLYSDRLDVLGLWHRHPGGLDTFSSTDAGTNKRFAEENDGVTISAIVNIDPKYRMTMYLVTLNPLDYNKIPFEVSDYAIPREIREITSCKEIENTINSNSTHKPTSNHQHSNTTTQYLAPQRSSSDESGRGSSMNQAQKTMPQTIDIISIRNTRNFDTHNQAPTQQRQERQETMSIDSINEALRAIGKKINALTPLKCTNLRIVNNNENFDLIVGRLYDVYENCEKKGMPITIEKGDDSLVNLIFGKYSSSLRFAFFIYDFSNNPATISNGFLMGKTKINDERLCFRHKEKIYLYEDNLFRSIIN